MSLGLGKSLMAPRNLSEGRTESSVTTNPRNSTWPDPNWNFFLLKTIPALELSDINLHVSMKFSSRLLL